jgi:hypothetical protein
MLILSDFEQDVTSNEGAAPDSAQAAATDIDS